MKQNVIHESSKFCHQILTSGFSKPLFSAGLDTGQASSSSPFNLNQPFLFFIKTNSFTNCLITQVLHEDILGVT